MFILKGRRLMNGVFSLKSEVVVREMRPFASSPSVHQKELATASGLHRLGADYILANKALHTIGKADSPH